VVNQPAHNQYHEKMLISFASGDIPDVVEIMPDFPQDYLQLAREGAIVPIEKYISKSKSFKNVNKMYTNALKYKGHIYATTINTGGGCPTYIRQDWLDNLGLKAPTNYKELYAVMKAFTFNDPDKNGKNDTVGYTLPGLDASMYMQDFYQGAEHDFVKKGSKWVDGFTQPAFKKALTRLRIAYKDKVIDQELFTNKTSTAREKFYAGKVGIFSYWSGQWGQTMQRNTALNFPKANVVALPAIKEAHYQNRIGPMIAITKACKNPESKSKSKKSNLT
jgi:putative aldouronate transport system substrate-binding protein